MFAKSAPKGIAVLFPSNPLNPKEVYPDHFDEQVEAAVDVGFHLGFVHEDGSVTMPKGATKAIYRGWMLTGGEYAVLYARCAEAGAALITQPKDYTYCHYLPSWYRHFKAFTPYTEIYPGTNVDVQSVVQSLFTHWAIDSCIVKDYVKSMSAMWTQACYIPDVTDTAAVEATINNFLEWQSPINGGLVFRDFVKIEQEYRAFVIQGKIGKSILTNSIHGGVPDIVVGWTDKVKSPFFTLDYALTENGNWIIVELGDGQVSDLKGINPNLLYTHLYEEFRCVE